MKRASRRWLAEAIHLTLACLALYVAFLLRFDFPLDSARRHLLGVALLVTLALKLPVFRLYGLRELAWRYTGLDDLLRIAGANLAASAASGLACRLIEGPPFPRSLPILDFVLCLALISGAHAFAKVLYRHGRLSSKTPDKARKRVAIYGAGKAGVTLAAEIRAHRENGFELVGFFDDDPLKLGLRVQGVKVLGARGDLAGQVKKHSMELVLIALPTASGNDLTAILEGCHAARVEAKRIPALAELIDHKVLVEQIRDVRLEDLLGRPPVELSEDMLRARLRGNVVLVTGAGGSIGSELCRQIARFSPAAIVGFDQGETPLYQIDQEMKTAFPGVAFYPEIGSVQNRRRLEEVFREFRPQTVYHAAAYKHVPLMESHLFEALENNVFGTNNVVWAATQFDADEFILVSSDKAVRPTNVMGATKRMAELVTMAAASSSAHTRFAAVRFGNVLGSNGSVIPLFKHQIATGGPVTVTHPEMRRFFMTIPEAAQLVLQASTMARGGEVFVLDMGEPVKIVDLARKLVLLSGLEPGEDIQIEFTGMRPGEKLYEELSAYEENTVPTPHSKIRIFQGPAVSRSSISMAVADLRMAAEAGDAAAVVLHLKELVPDYNPSAHLLRRAFKDQVRGVLAS